MREALNALDSLHLNFSQEGLLTLHLTLAFIMFGVALEIKPDRFRKVLQNPKSTIIGFISQFFFLPTVTFIVILIFSGLITPAIVLGMILVASCPGGKFSNFISSPDRRAITIETGIQNSGLALVLLFNPAVFPETITINGVSRPLEIGGMAFIAAWWGIWHILSGLSLAALWSRIPLGQGKKIFNRFKRAS